MYVCVIGVGKTNRFRFLDDELIKKKKEAKGGFVLRCVQGLGSGLLTMNSLWAGMKCEVPASNGVE